MSCRCSFSMVSAGKFIKNVSFNRQTTIFLSTRQTVKGLFSNKIFTELSEIQWNKFYGPWRKFHKKWKSADWSPDYFEQHYFTLYWIGVFLLSIFLEGFNEFISLLVRERIFFVNNPVCKIVPVLKVHITASFLHLTNNMNRISYTFLPQPCTAWPKKLKHICSAELMHCSVNAG